MKTADGVEIVVGMKVYHEYNYEIEELVVGQIKDDRIDYSDGFKDKAGYAAIRALSTFSTREAAAKDFNDGIQEEKEAIEERIKRFDLVAAALQYAVNNLESFHNYLKEQQHPETLAYGSEEKLTLIRQSYNTLHSAAIDELEDPAYERKIE